jgi:hypothetical protein
MESVVFKEGSARDCTPSRDVDDFLFQEACDMVPSRLRFGKYPFLVFSLYPLRYLQRFETAGLEAIVSLRTDYKFRIDVVVYMKLL